MDTKEDRPGEAALALYRDLLITPANKAVSGALNRPPSSAFDQTGAQENEGDREAKRNSPPSENVIRKSILTIPVSNSLFLHFLVKLVGDLVRSDCPTGQALSDGRALDYDDIAASAASAARRLSRSCSRLLPASAAAASNAARASS